MKKIYWYLTILTSRYIFINIFLVGILILFLNLLEISRILDNENMEIKSFFILSLLKIPSIISDTIPFVIVISIAFLFRNLISNNELIAMRNIGLSIIDIFKPIGITILIFGIFILIIINPISAKFERTYDSLTSKDFSDNYSIKFINEGMWIKNTSDKNEKNFINIAKIDLDSMRVKDIKILNINKDNNKIILAKDGLIEDRMFKLNQVTLFNIDSDLYENINNFKLKLNFDKSNIVDSISNYKFIPFYKYKEHINNLKKFNLHSAEVSLYYLSEILKPIFLMIIGFTVMGFSAKFNRNDSFFKILFIAILIGFLIFLLKEIIVSLTTSLGISFILSYFIILIFPLIIGLYQVIKIEID